LSGGERSAGEPGYFGGAALLERAREIADVTTTIRMTRPKPRIKPYQKSFENMLVPLVLSIHA
jgi:hypothetical protein